MFAYKDPFQLYKAYYDHPERRHLFVQLGRKKIEYADVFPPICTLLRTIRPESPYRAIKHLLVDEMQDYSAVQYAVLSELFSCKMQCLELTKSYRSTTEITEFTQNIRRNEKLVPINRSGTPPRIVACDNHTDEVDRILELVGGFQSNDYRSLGVVWKTSAQARALSEALHQAQLEVTLLDYDSAAFETGVVVTSAHLAKGLELDAVVVPHADEQNYQTEMDRSMLYVACTRAMHDLTLTHSGSPSLLLEFATVSA